MDSYQKILTFPEQFAWKPEIEHSHKKTDPLVVQHDQHVSAIIPGSVVGVSYSGNIEDASPFAWRPEIEHSREKIVPVSHKIAICGMGGSALAGDIIKTWLKRDELVIHRDFHTPSPAPEHIIAVSYSGNTEETLSVVEDALKKNIPLIFIASGGTLEAVAHKHKLPFIKLPSGYQPREAVGFMIRALTAILAPRHMEELEALAKLNGKASLNKGKKLGVALSGKIPLIYSSARMASLAYNWKIKFNETGKTPAFTAIIPELFHNEMTGFNMGKKTKNLAHNFAFILLDDTEDSPEVKKRIAVFKKFAIAKGFDVFHEKLRDAVFIERFISSMHLADWTSYFLAKASGADPENVPWVEEFKILNKKP